MNESKAWYGSKTIWSTVVGAAAAVLGLLFPHMAPLTAADQAEFVNDIVSFVSTAITLLGFAGALYGRFKAEKKLTLTKGTTPNA